MSEDLKNPKQGSEDLKDLKERKERMDAALKLARAGTDRRRNTGGKMSYIACPLCSKTGMVASADGKTAVECPCCGSAARRSLRLEGFLNQAGWTTAAMVHAYYSQLAMKSAEKIVERYLEIEADRNPGISNRQLKIIRIKKTKEIFTNLMVNKYKQSPHLETADDDE